MCFELGIFMPIFSLKMLLEPWVEVDPADDCKIVNLCADSRRVQKGDLFVALPGLRTNGQSFIQDAIKRGAVAVLREDRDDAYTLTPSPTDGKGEFKGAPNPASSPVPIIPIPHLSQELGNIAARFYQYPSQSLNIIGVTGTNGKTSCTHWIASALNNLGQSCGVIGTLGSAFPATTNSAFNTSEKPSITSETFTTPGPIQLQQTLRNFVDQQVSSVAMEVSSHGLAQNRVGGVNFDIGVFTNLSQDHLDYHGDIESYAAAKKSLFDWPNLKKRIFNVDDHYGAKWFLEYAEKALKKQVNSPLPQAGEGLEVRVSDETCIAYTLNPENHQNIPRHQLVYASDIHFSQRGITATIHTPWGEGRLSTVLIGRFNLSNLLAVLTSLCLRHISFEKALDALSHVVSPPGRMEVLGGNENPVIIVDYAHTPDALEQVLKSVSEHCSGQLWCVFGCGGDRDKTKRPIMGRIVEKYADNVVITDDNPRHEEASAIVHDILTGLVMNSSAIIEHDRRKAIRHAITCAKPNDIIVIAGKGHEHYQQIGDEKFPFSDRVEVLLALETGAC